MPVTLPPLRDHLFIMALGGLRRPWGQTVSLLLSGRAHGEGPGCATSGKIGGAAVGVGVVVAAGASAVGAGARGASVVGAGLGGATAVAGSATAGVNPCAYGSVVSPQACTGGSSAIPTVGALAGRGSHL